MRTRLNEYKIIRITDDTGYIYINRPTGFDISLVPQAIRLVINETKSYPLTHSMRKSYITGAVSGEYTVDGNTYNTQINISRTGSFSSEHFTDTDEFTVEVDWGMVSAEDIFVKIIEAIGDITFDKSDLAKVGTNSNATNTAILEAIDNLSLSASVTNNNLNISL